MPSEEEKEVVAQVPHAISLLESCTSKSHMDRFCRYLWPLKRELMHAASPKRGEGALAASASLVINSLFASHLVAWRVLELTTGLKCVKTSGL